MIDINLFLNKMEEINKQINDLMKENEKSAREMAETDRQLKELNEANKWLSAEIQRQKEEMEKRIAAWTKQCEDDCRKREQEMKDSSRNFEKERDEEADDLPQVLPPLQVLPLP